MPLKFTGKVIGIWVAWILVYGAASADAESWGPEVSLDESWRWNKLDFLDDYDVLKAAKGLGDDVWFVHSEGLIQYDGVEASAYELKSEGLKGVLDVYVSSAGQVYVCTVEGLIVWDEGEIFEFDRVRNGIMRRKCIVEDDAGRVFVRSDGGLYVFSESNLAKVETDTEEINSFLVDGKGDLWTTSTGTNRISVHHIVSSGQTIRLDLLRTFEDSVFSAQSSRLFIDSQDRVWVLDLENFAESIYFENGEWKAAFSWLGDVAIVEGTVDVAEVRPGEFWFASNRRLFRFDREQMSIFSNLDYPIPTTFPYLVVVAPGKLLLGGLGDAPQVIDLALDQFAAYHGLNFECEDSSGRLWFITEDRRVVRKTDLAWDDFGAGDGLIDTPNRIIEGPEGSIWVSGSHEGTAAVAWSKGEAWSLAEFPEVGATFSHLAALRSSENAMIFGGGTPIGELKGDRRGGGTIFRKMGDGFEAYYIPPPTFAQRMANLVERAGDGLWFGGANLFRSAANMIFSAERVDVVSDRWIDHMIVDGGNDLWIACQGLGIYQYDGDSYTLHNFSGGLGDKRLIYLIDDRYRDRLLALTESGFFAFDGNRWSRWGFQGDAPYKRESHSVFQSSDGAIWINHSRRSWYLEGEKATSDESTFKAIRYMPETDPPQTRTSIAFPRHPEGSQIQVLFEGSDFWYGTKREELEYSWRLNQGPWEAFSKEPHLGLSNVGTGNHSIEVKARDRAGNIDASPAVVHFEVFLPLWKETWFIALVTATVGLILFLVYLTVRIRVRTALAIDEFKLDFFTNISHELRNPLAVIISPVELLMEEEADPEKLSMLQIVLRNARKMQGMVDRLLQFRKLEKSMWVFEPADGEVMTSLRDSVFSLEPLWSEKEQSLTFACDPDSYLCSFDVSVVQQIVDNLISNAVKYSGQGTRISVEASIQLVDEQPVLLLSVCDEGKGVPIHEQENILKPFYRLKPDLNTAGSGVGLALVNQLVSQSGGKISVESPVAGKEKGSCFRVELPLGPCEDEQSIEADGADEHDDLEEIATILIVEDNNDLRHVLAQALSKQYKVFEASDGEMGLDQARKLNPSLIISDVMMPGIDGFALCEKLKSAPETSHIPIILLTAKSSNEHHIHGLKSGADAYIAKPLEVHHLKARIENLVESRRELKRRFAKLLMVEPTEVTVTPTDELILRKAIEIVEENMRDESFDVERFCKLMGMSGTSLRRKLKAITGVSPLVFIQQMRIKKAASLLGSSDLQVSDVASEVGIYDLSYFGKIFRKEFGVTPSSYKKEQPGGRGDAPKRVESL